MYQHRIGDQVWVEDEDGNGEWKHDPLPKCGCGRRLASECGLVRETTFTETYACGHVYRYANHKGYDDNLISVNGKRSR